MQRVLNEIIKLRKLDFSQYKEKLIERKVEFRLKATHSDSYEEYLKFLQNNPKEIDLLLNELTINVTRFFRDYPIFMAIKDKIIPALLANTDFIRIWSCGCSSGEEAISVLILLLEHLEELASKNKLNKQPTIMIYGTDIDKLIIEKAKTAIYEEYEFYEMPKIYQQKYFLDLGNKKFAFKKEYHKYLVFQVKDIINDPPLRNIQLILCRNLFIYFKAELQKICLSKFYQALKSHGFLVTGPTELLSNKAGINFKEYDIKHRIFIKN